MTIINNEIEMYSNKFNKMKDFERIKYLALDLDKRYKKSLDELYTINNIFNNNKDLSKKSIYGLFESENVFDLKKNILNLTSNIWNEAIIFSGIRKYLTDEQENKITENLGIVTYSKVVKSTSNKKELVEPNFKNILEYLYYIDTVKDNVIQNNLYEVINRNSKDTIRKNNKPLEISNMLIFDNIVDYKFSNYNTCSFYDNFHKSLCYIFNLSYSTEDNLYNIVNKLNFSESYIKFTKEQKEDRKEKLKLKYDYIPGIKFKVFKNSIQLFFEDEVKNKINELMIEYFKSTLVESK